MSAPDLAVESDSIPAMPASVDDDGREDVRVRDEERRWVGAELVRFLPERSEDQGSAERCSDGEREADGERDEGASGQREPSLHDGDAEASERSELGADHHGPDDQDDRVGEDAGAGDQRCEDHECEKAGREFRALGRSVFDLLPDNRIGWRADSGLLCALGLQGDSGIDRYQRDCAHSIDPELTQVREDEAGVFAGYVTKDEIAVGTMGNAW